MKTYVTHYSKLTDRKVNIKNLLKNCGIENYQFITEEPSDSFVSDFYLPSEEIWYEKVKQLDYKGFIPFKKLSKAEISITHKHYLTLVDICSKDAERALVLEDDVSFKPILTEQLNDILNDVPADWDLIFIGSGCNLRIPQERVQKNKLCYLKSHPASKCLDSFLIKKTAAEKILNTLMPFTLPIDFEYNHNMHVHDMKVYWVEPPIVKQGSQTGIYKSSIQ